METRFATTQVLIPAIKEILDDGLNVKLTVTGDSMLPFLRHERDQVELRSFDGNLDKGDIVLIRRDDSEYVLHRVITVDIETKTFFMVGDSQPNLEGPLIFEQINAVVIAIYRGGKRVDVQNQRYKVFVWFWFKLIRFRPFILRILRKLRIIP